MAATAAHPSGSSPNPTCDIPFPKFHVRLLTARDSVYVRNLDERVKIEDLTESLHEIFGEFGNIIDIVAKKSLKRKGQAFIVYDDVESATRAIEEIQGFDLFDKPMTLEYAKTRSDASVMKEGNDDEFEQHKRRRLAEKGGSYCCRLKITGLTGYRTEASPRSSGPEKTQTPGSRSPGTGSCQTSQGEGRWSQVYRKRRSCHSRRVLATEQDTIRTEHSRGLRCRWSYCSFQQV
jgi:RNA recognition motif-containing protein